MVPGTYFLSIALDHIIRLEVAADTTITLQILTLTNGVWTASTKWAYLCTPTHPSADISTEKDLLPDPHA